MFPLGAQTLKLLSANFRFQILNLDNEGIQSNIFRLIVWQVFSQDENDINGLRELCKLQLEHFFLNFNYNQIEE